MKQIFSVLWKSRFWLLGLAFGAGVMEELSAQDAPIPMIVRADYQNFLVVGGSNPAVTAASSAAAFTGTAEAYSPPGSGAQAVVPSGGSIRLVASSFGQTFSRQIPYQGFEADAWATARPLLYPPENVKNPVDIAKTTAAFRYKEVLYARINNDVRLNFETMSTLFGDAEREQIKRALVPLRDAIKYSPFDHVLRNALLDAYYDWLLAEQQLFKELRNDIDRYRLGLIAVAPNELIIDREIYSQQTILDRYEAIWTAYSGLLNDRMGVDVSQLDSTASPDMPFGSYIFSKEQSSRSQTSATFWEDNVQKTFSSDGSVVTGPPPVLSSGFKDYTALLQLTRDHVETSADLAKLQAMRGRGLKSGSDSSVALRGISKSKSAAFVNIATLDALVPNGAKLAAPLSGGVGARGGIAAAATEAEPQSGIATARTGIATAMAEMEGVAKFVNGNQNVLGFDTDMLVLLPSPQGAPEVADSYDAIMQWIKPDLAGLTVLGFAKARFEEATTKYEAYLGYADQLASQLSQVEDTYKARYRQITGYSPSEAPDLFPNPRPAQPEDDGSPPSHVNNPRVGSELYNAYLAIAQADDQNAQLKSMASKIVEQQAATRVQLTQAEGFEEDVNKATEQYRGAIKEFDAIKTSWNTVQAVSQATYQAIVNEVNTAFQPALPMFRVFGGMIGAQAAAVNISLQGAAEGEKGKAQQELDLANATFERDLATAGLNGPTLAASTELRNLQRQDISNTLALSNTAGQREIAVGQLASLLRELATIDSRRRENDATLAGRYFADPSHFLRAQSSLVQADFAFREAQRWVFFALRALEYKYNQPFLWDSGAWLWDASSLFALRNFAELDRLLAAMNAYDAHFAGLLIGRVAFTDHISLRTDVWKSETRAAFRSRLADTLDSARGVYVITLDTLALSRDLNLRQDQGAFFVGPEYDNLGRVLSAGRYLDKIDYIKFKFLAPDLASPQARDGNFSYGGVAYARSACSQDLEAVSGQAPGELLSFPFRYYRPAAGGRWTPTVNQEANVSLTFTADSGEPAEGANTFWRERSVAASSWKLEIANSKLDATTVDDLIIYVRHNAALRQKNCQ